MAASSYGSSPRQGNDDDFDELDSSDVQDDKDFVEARSDEGTLFFLNVIRFKMWREMFSANDIVRLNINVYV